MKKILIATVLLGAISCNKVLETSPQQELFTIKDYAQLQDAMRGAYSALKSASYYGGGAQSASAWSFMPDIMGEDFIEAYESLGNWRTQSEWRYAEDFAPVNSAFAQGYTVIARANDVLRFVGDYETGATMNGAKQIRAQALALRAHAHFDLMRYFAQSYRRNSDSLGVVYMKSIDPQDPFQRPSRGTVKQNYDEIYKDLTDAAALFQQAGNPDNTNRIFIDETVVHAMRARISLYATEWQDAIEASTKVINAIPLATQAEYPNIWTDATTAEVVWAVASDATMFPGFANTGNNANYRVATPISNIIFGAQGGIRSHSNAIRRNQPGIGGVQRTVLYKYEGAKNFKVFRTAEMYLIRAEAKYMMNNATALDDLNALRAARGATVGSETGVNLLNAIYLERRIELIGEGHRWFDIKRTTRTINRTECGSSGQSLSTICSVGPNSRSWIWPIPITQINLNPNLAQNPGY